MFDVSDKIARHSIKSYRRGRKIKRTSLEVVSTLLSCQIFL